MDALEEENFALSFSSTSDAEFDAVVGYLEDIIMDDEFQLLQRNFMDKYYQEFEDTEENKLTYTPIFNEYVSGFLTRNQDFFPFKFGFKVVGIFSDF